MKPTKSLPGSRALLSIVALVAGARATRGMLDEAGAPAEPIDPHTHYEAADLHPKRVFLAGLFTLLGFWAIVLLTYPLFNYFSYARTSGLNPSKVLKYMPPTPPAPRNEYEPHTELSDYVAKENAALNGYAWVDRNKGSVSIPIGRAIQIIAARGIPPSKPGGATYYPPSAGSKETGFEGKVKPEPR
jgi:hypothetical protein